MKLSTLGWNDSFQHKLESIVNGSDDSGLVPGRVVRVHKYACSVIYEEGDGDATLPGKLLHELTSKSAQPAVGDWVVIDPRTMLIRAILERNTTISRKVPGQTTEEQVIASNVDSAIIVTGLDANYNIKRIERYLTLVLDFGINPIIVLNKADVCEDVSERLAEVEATSFGFPVIVCSALLGMGVEELNAQIEAGKTYVLLGSSGAGKSTITNALMGSEAQKIQDVRTADGRGRHTTTSRELFVLPTGGMLIDNPGMREIQLWGDEEGLKSAFVDVESFAADCRFSDCTHRHEPGCAVIAAVDDGELSRERIESYFKMEREIQHLQRRQDQRLRKAEQDKWKAVAKWSKDYNKHRKGR